MARVPTANFGVAKKNLGRGSFPADNGTRDTIAIAKARGGICP